MYTFGKNIITFNDVDVKLNTITDELNTIFKPFAYQ